MKLEVLSKDGAATGRTVNLPKKIFSVEPNDHVIYLAVKAYLANRRQGTASTKTRSEVRGGGRKPWRQKGRGTARAGSTRSPLWVGGGRTFGPKPRDYSQVLPKKVKRLARLSALSYKSKEKSIKVAEDFTLDQPKTREMYAILTNLELANEKTLLLVPEYNPTILLAGRNIPNLTIRVAKDVSTFDIMNARKLLLQEGAVKKLAEVLS